MESSERTASQATSTISCRSDALQLQEQDRPHKRSRRPVLNHPFLDLQPKKKKYDEEEQVSQLFDSYKFDDDDDADDDDEILRKETSTPANHQHYHCPGDGNESQYFGSTWNRNNHQCQTTSDYQAAPNAYYSNYAGYDNSCWSPPQENYGYYPPQHSGMPCPNGRPKHTDYDSHFEPFHQYLVHVWLKEKYPSLYTQALHFPIQRDGQDIMNYSTYLKSLIGAKKLDCARKSYFSNQGVLHKQTQQQNKLRTILSQQSSSHHQQEQVRNEQALQALVDQNWQIDKVKSDFEPPSNSEQKALDDDDVVRKKKMLAEFVCFLVHDWLKQRDPNGLYKQARSAIEECMKKKQRNIPGYESATVASAGTLQNLIGNACWIEAWNRFCAFNGYIGMQTTNG